MLSDSCFECYESILEAVKSYDYADDHQNCAHLIEAVAHLLLVQTNLDTANPDRKVDLKWARLRAEMMYDRAKKSRHAAPAPSALAADFMAIPLAPQKVAGKKGRRAIPTLDCNTL